MKALAQSVLGKMGYRLIRADRVKGGTGVEVFFGAMKRLGFQPKRIVDVGANHGWWTRSALKYFPDAEYTLVEPQAQLKVHIEDLIKLGHKIRWVSAAVGEESGTALFSIAMRDDSSSLVPSAEEARALGMQQIRVEVKTLNEIAMANEEMAPEVVKIDAEGFDLRVLRGADRLFGKTEIIFVEATVCCEYENTVGKVMRFMEEAGYRLVDITDLNRSPRHGVLWLCELAFLRNESQLLSAAGSYE
jgi:FkbM family methyltransferase